MCVVYLNTYFHVALPGHMIAHLTGPLRTPVGSWGCGPPSRGPCTAPEVQPQVLADGQSQPGAPRATSAWMHAQEHVRGPGPASH